MAFTKSDVIRAAYAKYGRPVVAAMLEKAMTFPTVEEAVESMFGTDKGERYEVLAILVI